MREFSPFHADRHRKPENTLAAGCIARRASAFPSRSTAVTHSGSAQVIKLTGFPSCRVLDSPDNDATEIALHGK
jgi:hypothetical protein